MQEDPCWITTYKLGECAGCRPAGQRHGEAAYAAMGRADRHRRTDRQNSASVLRHGELAKKDRREDRSPAAGAALAGPARGSRAPAGNRIGNVHQKTHAGHSAVPKPKTQQTEPVPATPATTALNYRPR